MRLTRPPRVPDMATLGPMGRHSGTNLARPAAGAVLGVVALAVGKLGRLSSRYLPRMESSLKASRDRIDPIAYQPGASDLHSLNFTLTPERAAIVTRHIEEAKKRASA